jgi:aminodeoxyfutalosine deaminase
MRYFQADYIYPISFPHIPNGILVTEDDGTIIEVRSMEYGVKKGQIEKFNGILCPGFVNAHCHLELSFLKNQIPKHTGITGFIQELLKKRNAFTDKEKLTAIKLADAEMYNEGIVAVGDISNTDLTFAQKAKSKIYYHTFFEALDLRPENAKAAFAKAVQLQSDFKKAVPKNCASSIVPHAPYTVTPKLFEMIGAHSKNKIVTIHNQESKTENDFFNKKGILHDFFISLGNDLKHFKKTGRNSINYFLPYLKHVEQLMLVHNTFTTQKDFDYILSQKPNISLCFCPNANLYIENKLPKLYRYENSTVNKCIGTDSYASNNQLSIMAEMKTIAKNFGMMPIAEYLKWATLNGANALGITDKFGSFDKGKKPGIVHISNIEFMLIGKNSEAKRVL